MLSPPATVTSSGATAIPEGDTLRAAVAGRAASAEFQAVLARSSFLVDGQQAGKRPAETVVLEEGSVIEVLPPFAGG